MTQHKQAAALSRRDFVGGAAGLTLAMSFAAAGRFGIDDAQAAEGPLVANVWVTIAPDDTITIMSPAAELGQGSFTALPLILAEELDADWSKVKMAQPPWDTKRYGNPEYGNRLSTTSSFSVRGYFTPLRIAGAQARRVLLDAVAAKWNVPVTELSTEPSMVVHQSSNRKISYGAIAAFAQAPAELPKIEEKDLKPSSAFRLIGKDVPRVDVPLKVKGAAIYAMDVQVPGMIYAAVLQSPYDGGAPQTVDDERARKIPGVTDIVKLPSGVGVLGTTVEGTQAGKNALKVTWSNAKGADFDSERALTEFTEIARDTSRRGAEYAKTGNVGPALMDAATVMRGEYRTRHTYHAQMEPLNATASVSADGKSVELWAGTQGPGSLIDEIAGLLKISAANVKLNQQWVGGAYGRRSQNEVVVDAVLLSKAAGKPVKLIWSREDDMTSGKFRPMTAQYIEAGLDAKGKIVAWHHRVVAESVSAYTAAARGSAPPKTDQIVMKGTPIPCYGIPNKLAEHVVEARGTRVSAWRGVGVGHNAFAVECFLDEIAKATGKDPLAIRLELQEGQPRAQTLVRTVAEMSDWTRKREGTGLGIAFMEKDDTLAAGVAEVSIDRASGKLKVHNFWAAIDAGLAVQPRNVAAQTEGGIIFALGHVLREKITIKDGRVQQANFTDYQVTRMSDIPNVQVKVISTDNKPTGAGEDGVPLVAAAVGNAIFSLTGLRLRELPFSQEQVRGALGA
ncbi:MAG: isoquinoline 1-oxidoreductase subunit beta [Alphaproteobacteria bacterium]|jgi:isoquinoline 1-oxidoreductase beta subunit|nr:isoquinoline 1-oxidoreductase subunit beta [Alphaproteobacteria bacterium]